MKHFLMSSLVAAGALALLAGSAHAQFAERGALVGDGVSGVDCSGRSVKNPRTRAVHTTDPDAVGQEGGTAHLMAKDPFLAYQLGRNLNFREFRPRDGVFADGLAGVAGFGGPMVDGTTAKITTNNQTSCLGCHNLPNGNPGGGANFSKDSGFGRNSPHYYGAGIVEMLAIQNRAEMMAQLDTDEDGWISAAEANAGPAELLVTTTEGETVSYGDPTLDDGATGSPTFNNIVRVWYGGPPEEEGGPAVEIKPGASEVDGVTTTHYNFEIVVWGWGQRAPPSALNPTNRAFLWDPWATHGGLEAHDPSTLDDPDGDGVSVPTLAGAIQFPATHQAPDGGTVTDPAGYSLDDPDGDGTLTEISEGDLDLAEWFMLNAPRPAFAGTEKDYSRGLKLMEKTGCTACHVADWTIRAQDDTYAGDRRLFDLATSWEKISKKEGRLVGELVPLYTLAGDTYTPDRGSFEVQGFFSDLIHHDMGEAFDEIAFDGNTVSLWRTPPLWGVGSGFPWGHDGQSLTLEAVILRHGGEAQESADKFAGYGKGKRRKMVEFLQKLQLFDIETLPADVDGDGVISEAFMVAGVDTGPERFNAEWLFTTPVEIQGLMDNDDGVEIRSFAATNLSAAYGLTLPYRLDADGDGWPAVWDDNDAIVGYEDGVDE